MPFKRPIETLETREKVCIDRQWPDPGHVLQVEDASKLDYQAGQEPGQDDKDKKPPQQQQQQPLQQQQEPQAADQEAGEEAAEEAGVNEDTEDKYEDSHFAPPTAPEQVSYNVMLASHVLCTGTHGRQDAACRAHLHLWLVHVLLFLRQDMPRAGPACRHAKELNNQDAWVLSCFIITASPASTFTPQI